MSPRRSHRPMSPRRFRRLRRVATGALAVSALVAPSAGALPCEFVCGSATSSPSTTPAPTITRTIDNGFDWGAAGIGAGAGAAIVLVSLGGVRAGSRARLRTAAESRR